MNCDVIKREMLLLESGELSGRAKQRVEAHLRECAGCAGRLAAGRRLAVAAARMPVPDGPSAFVLTRIMAHAVEAAGRRSFIFSPGFRLAAAGAALVLVLLGAWPRPPTAAERIDYVHTLLSIVGGDDLMMADSRPADADERWRHLAGRLLRLQGFEEEDATAEEFWEPLAKDPQSHNTSGLPWTEYV